MECCFGALASRLLERGGYTAGHGTWSTQGGEAMCLGRCGEWSGVRLSVFLLPGQRRLMILGGMAFSKAPAAIFGMHWQQRVIHAIPVFTAGQTLPTVYMCSSCSASVCLTCSTSRQHRLRILWKILEQQPCTLIATHPVLKGSRRCNRILISTKSGSFSGVMMPCRIRNSIRTAAESGLNSSRNKAAFKSTTAIGV